MFSGALGVLYWRRIGGHAVLAHEVVGRDMLRIGIDDMSVLVQQARAHRALDLEIACIQDETGVELIVRFRSRTRIWSDLESSLALPNGHLREFRCHKTP